MEIELFRVGEGWGYCVGSVYQEYDPDFEGFVSMSKERAEECANIILKRLEN